MNKTALIAIAATMALTGCQAQKKQDQSTQMTAAVAAQSIADTQKQIQDIQNNQSIPDGTKQAIVGRLQGNINRTKAAEQSLPGAHTP
jgi:ABC-type enterochelin transport system substrate-binding protein